MREITPAVCQRLAEIRLEHYGPRGRSRFAQELGLTPSTYAHYEADRLPPVDVLLRAARLTHTRLEWLITGAGERHEAAETLRTSHAERLLDRLRTVLRDRPDLMPQVESYLVALEQLRGRELSAPRSSPRPRVNDLVPVVGSTSAGTARFWRELPESRDGPLADARLEELLAQCTGPTAEAPARFGPGVLTGPVSLVQLSRPDDRGLLEFLSAPQLRGRFRNCVAWRIDGASMEPRFLDGDLVVASPECPAESGHPCVARQRGQLGVNCKLYQREGDEVLLIPVNEVYPVQRVPAEEIVWAWRVVASVRL
jgi:transcriptional regulator with XRE-family HTH domain